VLQTYYAAVHGLHAHATLTAVYARGFLTSGKLDLHSLLTPTLGSVHVDFIFLRLCVFELGAVQDRQTAGPDYGPSGP